MSVKAKGLLFDIEKPNVLHHPVKGSRLSSKIQFLTTFFKLRPFDILK